MAYFISCDWGTTSFRMRLVETETKSILAETFSSQGISETYAKWKQKSYADKFAFYCDVILQQIQLLQSKCEQLLNNITVIISGMASSSIGMMEIPYKSVPYKINDFELNLHIFRATEKCPHRLIIISGICTVNDVMRGEETMLAGCDVEDLAREQLFIFPGTHSKHISVEHSMVKDFRTYMTGELFNLLSTKSILATSLEQGDTSNNYKLFIKGVEEITTAKFLNSIFHVRTNELFKKISKKENYYYLSGLLIGEELKSIEKENYISITLVSEGELLKLYTMALSVSCLKNKMFQKKADEALIKGQANVFNYYQ